jgi:predicted metal-dependent enzyme (double-stranded beta helix superfamily)
MHDSENVAAFMVEARALLAPGVSESSLEAVGHRLADLGRAVDFAGESGLRAMHGSSSTSTILQSDPDGLTLMLGRFSDAEETPVHDHNSWGVACVVHGVDRYRHWRMGDDGRVAILYEKELRAGSFVTWLDPPSDIHSQQGVGGTALELILFGKNVMVIPRRYYDPTTGDVTTALPQ